MKSIWKNHKFLISSLVYLLILGLIGYWVIFPLINNIKSKADDIQKKLIDNSLDEEKVKKIVSMEEEYSFFQKDKEALNVILNDQEKVAFIEKLEGLAAETNNKLILKVIEQGGDKAGANKTNQSKAKGNENKEKTILEELSYKEYLMFEVNLQGDYSGLIRFLEKLENSRIYINTISLSIKKEKEKEKEDNSLPEQSSVGNLFVPPTPIKIENNPSEKPQEKDILSSLITIIVYIQ